MDLLTEIEAFCRTHGISDSQFGIDALNDKNLIPDLRGERRDSPRRLWPETEARVRQHLATYAPSYADTPHKGETA